MSEKILLVDDEPQVLKALQRALHEEEYELFTAASGDEALALIRTEPIDVVISDEKMPGMSGGELLSIICQEFPDTIRILLTGQASLEAVATAVNQGEIYRFLTKPWNNTDLAVTIHQALQRKNLLAQNRELLQMVKEQSQALQEIERMNPGITKMNKDEDGALIIEDMDDTDDIENYLASLESDKKP